MENPGNGKRLFEEFPPVSPGEWEREILKDTGGADIGKLDWKPYEGFTVKPFFTAADLYGLEYLLDAEAGEFPYVRGISGGNNAWTIDERISAGTVREASRLALHAIESGARSLTFVCEIFDGRISGVPVESAGDMSRLLKDIPIGEVTLNFEAGEGALAILSLLLIEAGKRGIDTGKLSGSVDSDPLGSLVLTGHFPGGERESFEGLRQLVSCLSGRAPQFKALTVHAERFHDAGASAVEELAFTLASGVEYMDRLTSMDLTPDRIASHMGFSFPVSSNYFMEIAKLRAARLLWAEIMEKYGPGPGSSGQMSIRAGTSGWNKTVFDPYVNLLRGTVEAMAASVGGSRAINVMPLDSVCGPPGELTRRLARNTQLILKHESYIDRVRDPAAGSYYVERLTDSIADASFELFLEVEGMGGIVEALKSGFVQGRIERTARRRDMNIAVGKDVFVGVNQYPDLKEKLPKLSVPIKEKPLKGSRRKPPAGGFKSMEEVINHLSRNGACVRDAIPQSSGEPEYTVRPLRPYRGARAFEELRIKTMKYAKRRKKKPAVFLLAAGGVSTRSARAAFSANFFGCAGFGVEENDGPDTVEDGIKAALKSDAGIVVICSSDKEYPEIAPVVCKGIKDKKPGVYILIAGSPGDREDELRASGVDDFIHARSNALEILGKYQGLLGIDSPGGETP